MCIWHYTSLCDVQLSLWHVHHYIMSCVFLIMWCDSVFTYCVFKHHSVTWFLFSRCTFFHYKHLYVIYKLHYLVCKLTFIKKMLVNLNQLCYLGADSDMLQKTAILIVDIIVWNWAKAEKLEFNFRMADVLLRGVVYR